MTPEHKKLREMLLTRPLSEIPRSSMVYFAFWNGLKGNTAYKFHKNSTAWIAYQAGIDRAKAIKERENEQSI